MAGESQVRVDHARPGASRTAPDPSFKAPLREDPEPELRRITIKVTGESYDQIHRMAKARGITITELIKRALLVDDFFYERRDQSILLSNGTKMHEVLLVL